MFFRWCVRSRMNIFDFASKAQAVASEVDYVPVSTQEVSTSEPSFFSKFWSKFCLWSVASKNEELLLTPEGVPIVSSGEFESIKHGYKSRQLVCGNEVLRFRVNVMNAKMINDSILTGSFFIGEIRSRSVAFLSLEIEFGGDLQRLCILRNKDHHREVSLGKCGFRLVSRIFKIKPGEISDIVVDCEDREWRGCSRDLQNQSITIRVWMAIGFWVYQPIGISSLNLESLATGDVNQKFTICSHSESSAECGIIISADVRKW